MNDFCAQHMDMVRDMATVKQVVENMDKSFQEVKNRMVAHINDGEKEGGVRDRVKALEKETKSLSESVSSLKKAEWKRVIVAGVIGGAVSRSPEILNFALMFFK